MRWRSKLAMALLAAIVAAVVVGAISAGFHQSGSGGQGAAPVTAGSPPPPQDNAPATPTSNSPTTLATAPALSDRSSCSDWSSASEDQRAGYIAAIGWPTPFITDAVGYYDAYCERVLAGIGGADARRTPIGAHEIKSSMTGAGLPNHDYGLYDECRIEKAVLRHQSFGAGAC